MPLVQLPSMFIIWNSVILYYKTQGMIFIIFMHSTVSSTMVSLASGARIWNDCPKWLSLSRKILAIIHKGNNEKTWATNLHKRLSSAKSSCIPELTERKVDDLDTAKKNRAYLRKSEMRIRFINLQKKKKLTFGPMLIFFVI